MDVVLNIRVLAEGEGYASLADQLKKRGFERHVNAEGKPTAWRWKRKVDEHMHVVIEFLQDAGEANPGRPVSIDGERVSALTVQYVGIVHDWYQERVVTAELLDGAGTSTETVRFADVPAFIILKALALDDRHENKDAADLIHVLRYAGTPEKLRNVRGPGTVGLHPGAIQAGLEALRLRFVMMNTARVTLSWDRSRSLASTAMEEMTMIWSANSALPQAWCKRCLTASRPPVRALSQPTNRSDRPSSSAHAFAG